MTSLALDPRLNPFPRYAEMRATSPVVFNPQQNVWMVYGYDEIRTMLSDPATFSSRIMDGVPGTEHTRNMAVSDAPQHTRLRNLVSRAFTPKAVADLEPRIEAITHQLLDQVIESGQMDIIQDFGFPLPMTVIAELLGVPASEQEQFKEWSTALMLLGAASINGVEPAPEWQAAGTALNSYLAQMAEVRRAEPREDLISGLVQATIDGEQLTTQEIVNNSRVLLVAGNETTTHLIGNAVLTLLEQPELLARLRAEPQLIPSVIEEVLRYRSPVQFLARIATRDVELGGQLIRAKQRIIFFIGSANRDERLFADPDQFDITRSPNPHLGFGKGIHVCLGLPLARLETKVALTAILERLSDLSLVEAEALEPVSVRFMYGLRRLPVRFTPGARRPT